MPKFKQRTQTPLETRVARLKAAEYFVKGDRVRSKTTGFLGEFIELHHGFSLPEAWVIWDSDTESLVPVSCNPLDLEPVDQCNDSTQVSIAAVVEAACAIEQLEKPDEITENNSPSSLSCIPLDERSSPDTTHTSLAITTSETSVHF